MVDSGNGVPGASGGGRRQIIVVLCAACAFISIADRSSLSVLTIDMKEELKWTAREEATIMSSFYYGTLLRCCVVAMPLVCARCRARAPFKLASKNIGGGSSIRSVHGYQSVLCILRVMVPSTLPQN